jgi:hypothetical protein
VIRLLSPLIYRGGMIMKILLAHFSRSGHTGEMAGLIAEELRARGHAVDMDEIRVTKRHSRLYMIMTLTPLAPTVLLSLILRPFRKWHYQWYKQIEFEIQQPAYPDVSAYDRICIGGPKWAYISYPIARYIKQVRGLKGKKVGKFASLCGPPLKIFELELLFNPMAIKLREVGAKLVSTLVLSSNFHELFIHVVFKFISRIRYGCPLSAWGYNTPYGKASIKLFCDKLESNDDPEKASAQADQSFALKAVDMEHTVEVAN